MKQADKIKKELIIWCRSHAYDIVIPNFFIGNYEMDVFKLMRNGYLVEYEIKVSRSDFFADFKKGKHYYNREKLNKHEQIKNGKLDCNRFFFVMPEGLLGIEEIPKYAGLIVFDGRYLYTVKHAPLIHRKQIIDSNPNIYRELAWRLSGREDVIKRSERFYKYKVDELKKKCENLIEQLPKNNIQKFQKPY